MFQANLEYCKSNRKTIHRFRLLQWVPFGKYDTYPLGLRLTTGMTLSTNSCWIYSCHLSLVNWKNNYDSNMKKNCESDKSIGTSRKYKSASKNVDFLTWPTLFWTPIPPKSLCTKQLVPPHRHKSHMLAQGRGITHTSLTSRSLCLYQWHYMHYAEIIGQIQTTGTGLKIPCC